ncbi:hypothetical protein RUM44_007118 [Polyplax serrata]|uniref:Uncharacterized protein n=1 Tax=Polyplax serrata TaxID=468196 RepID=A0ABR1AZT4_POLSC
MKKGPSQAKGAEGSIPLAGSGDESGHRVVPSQSKRLSQGSPTHCPMKLDKIFRNDFPPLILRLENSCKLARQQDKVPKKAKDYPGDFDTLKRIIHLHNM